MNDPSVLVSRRGVARAAAWSVPVVVLAAAAPAVSASTLAWSLVVDATPQDCAPGVNGGATTVGGYELTNIGTGSGTGPIIGIVTILIYTGQVYESESGALVALNAANSAFEGDPPTLTVTGPPVTTCPWSQNDSEVFDLGDGTFTASSIYSQQQTVLGGVAPVALLSVVLTSHDLPGQFLIQAYYTPVTPISSDGEYGEQIQLFDSSWCGVFPPDSATTRRPNAARVGGGVPDIVRTWFERHSFGKVY